MADAGTGGGEGPRWWPQWLTFARSVATVGLAAVLTAASPRWPGYFSAVLRGSREIPDFALDPGQRALLALVGLGVVALGLYLERQSSPRPAPRDALELTAPPALTQREHAERLGLPATAVADLGRSHAERLEALVRQAEQHRIYSAIAGAADAIRQDVLEAQVGYDERQTELYYRLEALRLVGLIERKADPSARRGGRTLYWYRAHNDGSARKAAIEAVRPPSPRRS